MISIAKPKIVVAAPVQTRSGYGAHSREIVRALIRSDRYDVSVVSLRWGSTPMTALSDSSPEDRMILDRIIPGQLQSQPDVFIHITIPNEFQKVGRKNIGITAGIETTGCRKEWIDGCNRMDLVIATSKHSRDTIVNSKYEQRDTTTNQVVGRLELTSPIEVLFEGIDRDVYNPALPMDNDLITTLNGIPEDFCFLFVGHWLQGAHGQDRKDVGGLIQVFLDTFKRKAPQNRPALILKTSRAGFSTVEFRELERMIQDVQNISNNNGLSRKLPNIYLLHGDLSDSEMNTLYNHSKVKAMVSFTKGEGFGKPLLEFTTTGKPLLASAWSGQLDFMHPEYSILLPGKLTQVHPSAVNDWIMKETAWFSVDYGRASQIMSDVCDNYKTHLERSRKHRKYTYDNFSFELMTDKLVEYIDNIDTYKSGGKQFVQLKLDNIPAEPPPPDSIQTITLPKLTKL